ncbi:hypothetical protein UA08_03789 [Talaromyces atroroseus]|uniref:DASH complex subunit DAM1 n=1 Tax=Talaromyces atroroseus TaxID=1441469 RepID=A0A225B2N0_TALAT|nr:hypothetical protein UA08_03789 [Talaromyces atroroseus]OKL61085.1 hypothetical protein UA08_03789 [Talaromyces atroroseus]
MDAGAPRSASRPRPASRPTTPLRPSSRSSIRNSHGFGSSLNAAGYEEPAIHALEPQFAELADSMADLEANFMHLQLMHESLSRFSESFASFLYGLNMNAFCVDFPEVATTILDTALVYGLLRVLRLLFRNLSSGHKKQKIIKVAPHYSQAFTKASFTDVYYAL